MSLRPLPKPKLPRVGRPTGHFTQHRRLDKLRETLEANPDGLSLDDLAMVLHVTTRSIRRYLHELSLIVDVESLETTPGGAHLWRIKPSARGRAVPLRRTQAYGILSARKVFDVLKGSALYDEVDVAMRDVSQIAHRPTRGAVKGEVPSDQRLEDRFLYVPGGALRNYSQKSEELDDLFQAVAELKVVRFRYLGARVTVHPYALVLEGGAVTCVGYDVEEREVKAFLLERIEATEPQGDAHFRLPADFDLAAYLHGAFGVHAPARGARPVRVLVEFEAKVAEDIRQRRFHPTQRIATAPDGRVRLSFSIATLDPVRSWVLGFGAAARVIEPLELAADIAREHKRALARYER